MKLTNCNIKAVALVDKPASGINWSRVEKAEDGSIRFRTFATFEKAEDHGDKVVVSGIAYASLGAAHPDKQGDFCDPNDPNGVPSMVESFARNDSRLSFMHQWELTDAQAKVTKSELTVGKNWSLTAEVYAEDLKTQIRSGKLAAWSVEGTAQTKAEAREMSAEQIEANRQSKLDYEARQIKLDMQRAGILKRLSKSGKEPTEAELLATLADARALLQMAREMNGDTSPEDLERMLAALGNPAVEQRTEELSREARAAAYRREVDEYWRHEFTRMDPVARQQQQAAEQRLRERQADLAAQAAYERRQAEARAERLDL